MAGSQRIKGTEVSVWVEFIALAAEHNAVSLGQGFPDYHAPPDHVRQALIDTVSGDNPLIHQYTRGYGHPRLVKILAKFFSPLFGQDIDPMTEVLVTSGAYESLFCAFQGFINPGDEVIVIEPYFDCYSHMTKVAGGTARFVPLRPKSKPGQRPTSSADWVLDPDELEAAFTAKTKLLIFNNPNNPVGKVWTRNEMEVIADKCKKHDVVVISDEVYEWMTYDGHQHIRMATLPDMWQRTVTIGSAGKTFSVTGWKTGWSIAPKQLLAHMRTVHQNCVYTCPTPIQEAVAIGMETEAARFGKPDCYFEALAVELQPKRDMMAKALMDVGMVPTVPDGGYFMMADFSGLDVPFDPHGKETKDVQFVKWLTKEKKLAAIPPSAFYSQDHKYLAENWVRFCFIKKDETLEKAANVLKEWKKSLK